MSTVFRGEAFFGGKNMNSAPTCPTSFRKKGNEVRRIPGTKFSYHNAQLLTSTGIPSLDQHLGGGLAIGTLILIEEDVYGSYSNVLMKYFIAEGIMNGHSILFAAENSLQTKLLQDLPGPIPAESKKGPSYPHGNIDQLNIAWRYKESRHHANEQSPSFCHRYDLKKKMPKEQMDKASIIEWDILDHSCQKPEEHAFLQEPYYSLLKKIKETVETGRLQNSEQQQCSSVLRVVIGSLGSPLWNSDAYQSDPLRTLPRFLYSLRAVLRSSLAVAFVTVPLTFLKNARLMCKLQQMSDYIVGLDSVVVSARHENPLLKDFHGLIRIVKIPHLNSFAYQVPASDLAFKLHRKNFSIESLHLPPDVEDQPSPACGAPSKLLEF